MTVEEALAENIRRLNLHPVYRGQLIPPDARQVALTKEWILPNEVSILADLFALRKEVDAVLFQHPLALEEKLLSEKEYPYGLCRPIRDAVYAALIAGMERGATEGLRSLAAFVRSGGIIQPFWGIDKGRYFQNAIQAGDTILDVANDTVDAKKVPIVLYPSVADAPIQPVRTFDEYASIAESYWGHVMYPNVYIPELAPVFPMLSLERVRRADGSFTRYLVLHTDAADLAFKNLYAERDGYAFGLAREFLLSGAYASKRLPSELESTLRSRIPSGFRIAEDESDLRTALDSFPLVAGAPVPRSYLERADQMRLAGLMLRRVPLGESEARA